MRPISSACITFLALFCLPGLAWPQDGRGAQAPGRGSPAALEAATRDRTATATQADRADTAERLTGRRFVLAQNATIALSLSNLASSGASLSLMEVRILGEIGATYVAEGSSVHIHFPPPWRRNAVLVECGAAGAEGARFRWLALTPQRDSGSVTLVDGRLSFVVPPAAEGQAQVYVSLTHEDPGESWRFDRCEITRLD